MTLKQLFKSTRLPLVLIIISLIILYIAGGMWWRRIYTNPSNVFDRMLDNALSTNAIAKYTTTDEQGQKVNQVTNMFLNTNPEVHGLVEINQSFEEQSSTVKRETLTASNESFVRLVSIDTTQKNAMGKDFDFSSITGVWGKSPVDAGNNSVSQLYGQNVAIPFANLPSNQRKVLLNQIKTDKVYSIDFEKSKMSNKNGRPVYEIQVTVKPESFVKMMKTLGEFIGSDGFKDVNSDEYKEIPEVSFRFSVDVLSGDLIKIDYQDGQIEDYAGNGLRTLPTHPKNAITVRELQERLQKLQQ